MRYGPGFDYPIKYVYKKKYLPIEVIDKKENFRRIIDFKKNSGWIHISQLKKSNSLIILENKILFKKPSKFSKPLVKLEKGRLLIIKKCKNKWCQVNNRIIIKDGLILTIFGENSKKFYFRSKRSRFITFVHADIKSARNLSLESSQA